MAEARLQLSALLAGEPDLIANAANTGAFLMDVLPALNWAGFYFKKADELVLGPFQGKPACVRIPVGKGVCGTCAALAETVRVDDVHAFPGHIACDVRSRSELVVPVMTDDQVLAVVDLDSPDPGRFSESDRIYVEVMVDEFTRNQFGGQ
ncbi:MAG: GAF domain-containing protein [Pseudomonadota bacterium]